MKLRSKILFGFGLLIIIAIVQGVYTYSVVSEANQDSKLLSKGYAPLVGYLSGMQQHVTLAGYYSRAFFYSRDASLYQLANTELDNYQKVNSRLAALTGEIGQLSILSGKASSMLNRLGDYQKLCNSINSNVDAIKEAMDQMSTGEDDFEAAMETFFKLKDEGWEKEFAAASHEPTEEAVKRLGEMRDGNSFGVRLMERFDMAIGDFWRALARYDADEMTAVSDSMTELMKITRDAAANVRDGEDKTLLEKASRATQSVSDAFKKIEAAWASMLTAGDRQTALFDSIRKETSETAQGYLNDVRTMAENNNSMFSNIHLLQLIGMALMVLAGLAVSFMLTRSIALPLDRIISALSYGADSLSMSSGSINASSRELSDGAMTQAASLEETSSALEQMASMTRQNADSAQRTNETTQQTGEKVNAGSRSVNDMAQAMGEINESSEKVSRIIKTIEEIAFQTNLLALNAAVEAARAGEAGKGFAVVADEVRNLAQRSAQAARDTAELIAGTVDRVKNGTVISAGLGENFKEIEIGVGQVGKLIADIAAATNEQAQGVDQVNTAVARMDQVTQKNASGAQHTLDEAAKLQQQADALSVMVAELTDLVHGRNYYAGHRTGRMDEGLADLKPQRRINLLPAPK